MTEVTRIAGAALLFLMAAGCGSSLPPETNQEAAKEALVAALDAWKGGKTPESLRERKPAVDFLDLGWQSGAGLSDYKVMGQERHGAGVRFKVALSLKPKSGPG